MRLGEGGNYSIDLEENVATLRVWRRPDLTFDEGARLAVMILDDVRRIAARTDVRGFVMDLREAPALTGKRTRATHAEIVGIFEVAKKPISVLLAEGVQHATLTAALPSAAGPTMARFFTEPDSARAWAAGID
jgi:hypothetical protein